MVIGEMRYNIVVKRLTITRDADNGSPIQTWADQYKLKAKIPRGSGNKTVENEEIFNTSTLRFITHYRDILEKDRIYYDEDWYKIMLINPINYKEGLEIVGEKIND